METFEIKNPRHDYYIFMLGGYLTNNIILLIIWVKIKKNYNMNKLIEFLQSLGIQININPEIKPIVLFSIVILVLTLIALLCSINIFIYAIIIYISENEKILNFIKKYKLLFKIFNYYKKTRLVFIIIEFLFLIFILSSIA